MVDRKAPDFSHISRQFPPPPASLFLRPCICYDPLRLPVVLYHIRSDPSHDKNRAVRGLPKAHTGARFKKNLTTNRRCNSMLNE